jgi:hypothetical protein
MAGKVTATVTAGEAPPTFTSPPGTSARMTFVPGAPNVHLNEYAELLLLAARRARP